MQPVYFGTLLELLQSNRCDVFLGPEIRHVKRLVKTYAISVDSRGLVKEEYLMIILGYFFLFLKQKCMLWVLIRSSSRSHHTQYSQGYFWNELNLFCERTISNKIILIFLLAPSPMTGVT